MAFVERKLLPELYRNQNPRRSPRASKSGSATRSLVNCNHLATSDTKVAVTETLAERLARKTEAQQRRAAQKFMHRQLMGTLKGIALREKAEDLEAHWNGAESSDKGPWQASKDYRRLNHCQSEWIGFKASCCDSRAVAVPIGCNHRLCPLCNAARLEHYRGPAREMLAAMEHPTFLTLTVPNVARLTRRTFNQLRQWWKEFFRSNKRILRGGLYAIEVTFNRESRTWHPHFHIVFDAPWPTRGVKRNEFLLLKRTLEFSWLRITSKDARKVFRRNEYQRWQREAVLQSPGSDWNQRYRRVVDIRPVTGENAVYEVIKYVSKTNRFLDIPEAVEVFLRAIRGVRVMQTFGTFYNFKMEVPITKEDVEALAAEGIAVEAPTAGAASFLKCDCGKNHFKRIGVFSMSHVEMDSSGRWLLRPEHVRQRCRGSSIDEGEEHGIY